jgi:hypothetical protein
VEQREWPELISPDPRTLVWGPLGLGAQLTAEQSVQWLQEVIAASELASCVPDELRRSYERLCMLHVFGVVCYDLFTIVDEHSRLLLEQALRTRFAAYYDGDLPIVSDSGEEGVREFDSVGDLADVFGRGGDMEGWSLRGSNGAHDMPVPLTLQPLLEWARAHQLLSGQRSKVIEQAMVSLRNLVAHPESYHLVGPVDSAHAVRDLAEVINRLWGQLTPGGRLYPGPIRREVRVISWRDGEHGLSFALLRPENLSQEPDDPSATCLVIRAVPNDGGLWHFDARYEATTFPCDLLWGPGSHEEALAYLQAVRPAEDEITYTDRLFAIRFHKGKLYLPQRPEVVLDLRRGERSGKWRLLRADDPWDEFAYVRRREDASGRYSSLSGVIGVQTLAVGGWAAVVSAIKKLGVETATPSLEVRVPTPWSTSGGVTT